MRRLLQFGLLLLALTLCIAPPSFAQCSSTSYGNGFTCKTFDIGGNNNTGQTSVTITLGSTPSAGDAVFVGTGFCRDSGCGSGGTLPTVGFTNGSGDTVRQPTTACRQNNVGSPGFVYYQCIGVFTNVSATTSFTVNYTGGSGANYPRFYVALLSGVDTSSTPFDTDTTSCASAVGGTSLSCAVTLSTTGIVYAIAGNSGGVALTPGNSFTEIGEGCTEGSCGNGNQQQARSNTSGATNATWTQSADSAVGLAVGIKAAAGGGGAPACNRTLLGVGC